MAHDSPPRLPPRPEPPQPGDCCGGGCERCVIDVYEQRLQEWQEAVAILRARDAGAGSG